MPSTERWLTGDPIGISGGANLHGFVGNAALDGYDILGLEPPAFRRSFTTELIRHGANLWHVKEALGHESVETLAPYVKLTIPDLKKTMARCHPRERDAQ